MATARGEIGAELAALLRLAVADLDGDPLAATIGISQLLRVFAAQVESITTLDDMNAMFQVGVGMRVIGDAMISAAVKVRP